MDHHGYANNPRQRYAHHPMVDSGSLVLITRLSIALHRRATEEALGMRLKPFVALTILRDHGSMSQQALGEALQLDPNNVVLLLNDVEAAGFVERRRDPNDRRRHIVELTGSGRKAIERAEGALEDLESEVLRGLSADERGELRRLLQRALDGGVPALAAAASADR
jgi:MarR family transcriptional regulator, temperature-dependent positive regulator of motility